jgi:hypothetical protein
MEVNPRFCRLHGLTFESPFPLQGSVAVANPGGAPDVVVHWEPESAWRTNSVSLVQPDEQELRPRVSETSEGALCVEWRREVQFVFPPENNCIIVICSPAKVSFVPAALIGIGMGILLHRRGILCLHGAALRINGRTIALLGESGAGKSTTSAALITRGAIPLSDDLVSLRPQDGCFFVEPGSTGFRLNEAAVGKILVDESTLTRLPWVDKLLWDVRPSCMSDLQAQPLDAIYLLGDVGDGHSVQVDPPLSPLMALRELTVAWYPPGLRYLLTQTRLDDLRAVAECVPTRIVRFPRQWDMLPALHDALVL